MKVDLMLYHTCEQVSRDTVLNDLDYMYEDTVTCYENGQRYDVYSDHDGNYVCVKEDE